MKRTYLPGTSAETIAANENMARRGIDREVTIRIAKVGGIVLASVLTTVAAMTKPILIFLVPLVALGTSWAWIWIAEGSIANKFNGKRFFD
jgi:hypothetical protein